MFSPNTKQVAECEIYNQEQSSFLSLLLLFSIIRIILLLKVKIERSQEIKGIEGSNLTFAGLTLWAAAKERREEMAWEALFVESSRQGDDRADGKKGRDKTDGQPVDQTQQIDLCKQEQGLTDTLSTDFA